MNKDPSLILIVSLFLISAIELLYDIGKHIYSEKSDLMSFGSKALMIADFIFTITLIKFFSGLTMILVIIRWLAIMGFKVIGTEEPKIGRMILKTSFAISLYLVVYQLVF